MKSTITLKLDASLLREAKLLAAEQAIRRGIQAVGLLDGRGEHPLTRAFEGAGTWVTT